MATDRYGHRRPKEDGETTQANFRFNGIYGRHVLSAQILEVPLF